MEELPQGHALVGGPGGALGDGAAGDLRALVAHEGAEVEAVGLFAAADERGLAFLLLLDFGNVLETGEDVVALDAEVLADGGQQFTGDDRLDAVLLAVQLAEFLPAGEDVVGEEAPGLVAGELDHLAFVVADGDAQAVGVRVGGEDEVRAGLVGLRQGHLHGRGLLRVRGDDRREIAVADILLGNMDDVLEADAGEGFRHELDAAAVQRGVDDLEVRVAGDGFRGQHEGQLVLQVALVDLGAHRLDTAGNGAGDRGETDVGRVLDLRDLGDDVLVHGRGDLAAVAPEDLVAVILLGVVAGRDHDAGGRALEADGIAQFRGGAQGVEQVDVDAVVGEDVGGNLGEQPCPRCTCSCGWCPRP